MPLLQESTEGKIVSKKDEAAAAVRAVAAEQLQLIRDAARKGRNLGHFHQLVALKAYLEAQSFECLTIGNGNPKPYHCFACTWTHLYREVRDAVEFWEQSAYRNEAIS